MGKTKSNWLQRFSVKVKVKSPVGIQLTTGETLALADIYESDVKKIKKNEQEVLKAVGATIYRDADRAIDKSLSARSTATAIYKRTKDPVKKREWARRILVADHTLKSIRSMKKRMSATHDRLEMIKGDIELQLIEAEARHAEAKAYAQAGKQLRLVGQGLIDARTRARSVKLEYQNLEINMENAEKFIDKRDPVKIIEEVEKLLKAPNLTGNNPQLSEKGKVDK